MAVEKPYVGNVLARASGDRNGRRSSPCHANRSSLYYQQVVGPLDQPWPLPTGAVHPTRPLTNLLKGRAEERHDAVTHHLVHGALVGVHSVHHALDHGVEDAARILGVAVGEQLQGRFHVREENGDMLALALHKGFGNEDPLSQILGCVGVWGAELALARVRGAATSTELVSWLVSEAA